MQSNTLIIGRGNAAKLIAVQYCVENNLAINLVGYLDINTVSETKVIPGIKRLGTTSNLYEIAEKYKVEEIIISTDHIQFEDLIELLDKCAKLRVRIWVSSLLLKTLNEKMGPEKYYDIPLLDINSIIIRNNYEKWKRIFDFMLSLIGIILLTPVFAAAFILIRTTSRGAAIYKQERIGKNGKKFVLYKFRTMYIADEEDATRKKEMIDFMNDKNKCNGSTKVVNDNRVTKIGHFLRKTSIDELPQLYNVVRGDMSLVGPRPSLPYEYSEYKVWQKRRTAVLPGCTGLWQVMGRNTVSFIDSTLMDIYYIYKMSPLTDLEYILRTVPSMLFAKGK